MSATAVAERRVVPSHPNTLEAIEHRRACVMHAARTLYRDQEWVGSIAVSDWLRRIHYLSEETVREWLETAAIDALRPVRDLRSDKRDRLLRLMIAYAKDGER